MENIRGYSNNHFQGVQPEVVTHGTDKVVVGDYHRHLCLK
jgi:hypothetical protein